jgi:hypothetical protein
MEIAGFALVCCDTVHSHTQPADEAAAMLLSQKGVVRRMPKIILEAGHGGERSSVAPH